MAAAAQRGWVILVLAFIAVLVVVVRRGDLLPLQQPPFPHGEVRIGVDASLPPFAYVTPEGDLAGLDIDIGRALAAELDVPVRFVNMGIDGLYDSLRADRADVILSTLVAEPWRTGDVLYSRPYFDAGLVLVSPTLEAMRDLPGHALAYEFGSLADTEARQWARRVAAFETQPYELPVYALDAVRLGEADAALVGAVAARLYRRDYADWDVEQHYVTHRQYVLAVDIGRPATFRAIDRALGRIMASGEVDAIIAAWLG